MKEAGATVNTERTAGRVGGRGAGKVNTDLLMLLAVVIWGINFTAVKVAVSAMAPMAFNAVRFTLATVVTFCVLAWQTRASRDARPFRAPVRDAGRIILLGLAGHGIYQILFGNGMAHTVPGNASLLMATSPLWVAVLGYLLRIERINRVMALGIFVSFAGISLVILGGGNVSLGAGSLLGDAMILGCAVLWAVYTVGSKPLLGRYSPLELTAWSMLAGTVMLVAVSLPQIRSQDWSAVSPLVWGALIYSAVFSVAIGYVVYSASVQRVGNARTAVYSNLTPIVAILFAWVTLGETLTVLQLAGGAIVLTGLLVTRRGRAR